MRKSFRILLIALTVILTVGLFGVVAQATDATATLKEQAAPDASKIKLNLKTDALNGINDKMEWMDATSDKPVADSTGTSCGKELKLSDIGMSTNADGAKKIAFRYKASTGVKASPWTTISIKAIPAKPLIISMDAASKPKTSIYVDWDKEVFVNVTDKYEYELSTKAGKWNKHKAGKVDTVNLDLSKFAKTETKITIRAKGDAAAMLPNGEPSDPVTLLARPGKLGKTLPKIDTTAETLSLPGIDDEAVWQYNLDPKEKANPIFVGSLGNTDDINLNAVQPLKGKEVNLIQDKSASLGVRVKYSFADDGLSGKFSSPMLVVKVPVRAKPPKVKYDFVKETFTGKGKLQYYLVKPVEYNDATVTDNITDLKADITKPTAVTGKVITTLPAVSVVALNDSAFELVDGAYPIKVLTKTVDEMKGKLTGFAEANGTVPAPAASDINLVYRIRTGPTEKAFASSYESYTVNKRAAPSAVSATLDYNTEKLIGSATLEYVLDLTPTVVGTTFTVAVPSDASWVGFDKKTPSVAVEIPDYAATAAYSAAAVRVKANKTTVKSEVLPILIPMRANKPTQATIDYAKEDLAFTEVATTLEFSLNDVRTYTPIIDKNVDAATKKLFNLTDNKILTDKSDDLTMTYRVKAVAPNPKATTPITPVESRFASEPESTDIPARPVLAVELEAGDMGKWSVASFSVDGATVAGTLTDAILYSFDAIDGNTTTTVTTTGGTVKAFETALLAKDGTSQNANFKLKNGATYFQSPVIKATFKKTQKGKLTLEKDSGALTAGSCDITITINNGDSVVVADGTNVKLYALKGTTIPTGTGAAVIVTGGKVLLAAATYADTAAGATSSSVSFALIDETVPTSKIVLAEGTISIPHIAQVAPLANGEIGTVTVADADAKITITGSEATKTNLEFSISGSNGTYSAFTSGTSVAVTTANSTLSFRYKAQGFGKAGPALNYDVKYDGNATTGKYTVTVK